MNISEQQLRDLATKIIKDKGPDRVVIDRNGKAAKPKRAQIEHGVEPDIIFVRKDGWSLGAPAHLEEVAWTMWPDQMEWFSRKPFEELKPISEYQFKGFTGRQIQNWRIYERVQRQGRWNMYDPRARQATRLSESDYSFVMDNYEALMEAAKP